MEGDEGGAGGEGGVMVMGGVFCLLFAFRFSILAFGFLLSTVYSWLFAFCFCSYMMTMVMS